MYKDIITYELAEGVSEETLLTVAKEVVNEWMKKQPGFIKWEINQDKDGNYTDIVTWKNREAAIAAEKDMPNIPNGADWMACYKPGSIASKNITLVAEF